MLIAGEASGDTLAAELVRALRDRVVEWGSAPTADVQPLRTALAPRFFGAGGPRMAAAGVELAFDLTHHSVVGLGEAAEKGFGFLGRLRHLKNLAVQKQPDAIVLVDFSFFNHLFARVIRWHLARHRGLFNNWSPRIVKYVSPQVWASRPRRADRMPRDFDLLLSIFPFEKDWYAKRVPKLRVEFVGHPMLDRFSTDDLRLPSEGAGGASTVNRQSQIQQILLLPGSRKIELRRHLPVMLGALKRIQSNLPNIHAKIVLPDEPLVELAKSLGTPADLEIQTGNLPAALRQTDLALASTGTVTMECAFFGVPTVTLYKTSWSTYHIVKSIVMVKSLTMPNLLAGAEVFPEFIQNNATPDNLARAALELLHNPGRREKIKGQLDAIVASLGGPGASRRAAEAIVSLLP
jgi:lipid-A-disaccharide synthase